MLRKSAGNLARQAAPDEKTVFESLRPTSSSSSSYIASSSSSSSSNSYDAGKSSMRSGGYGGVGKAHASGSAVKRKPQRLSIVTTVLTSISLSLLLSAPLLYILFTRLGIGAPFPQQLLLSEATPVLSESALDVVAELPMPLGNIAVSSRGRIFFSYHPEYNPFFKILELKSNKQVVSFPSDEFQRKIITVLSLRVDTRDRLWLLDFANHGISGSPRLYAFDLRAKDIMSTNYSFPSDVAGFGSMLNDFQVDPKGEYIYIADTSLVGASPALVVYSIAQQRSFRILDSHPSMFGLSAFINITATQDVMKFGPLGVRINVDSIVLDRNGEWLYYGAMTGDKLFALPVAAIRDELQWISSNRSLGSSASTPPPKSLTKAIKLVCSEKPVSDGLSIDGAGNIWMTAVEHSALVVAVPFRAKSVTAEQPPAFSLVKAVQSPQLLRWPDGLSFGTDGLYITSSALHLRFLGKNISANAPFHILRLPFRHLKNKDLYRGQNYLSTPAGH